MSFFEEKNPEMDDYLERHTSEEPPILRLLRRETYQKTTQPHMISGIQQGRLLSILSQMLRPKKILEIGTFTGYATLSLAEGLPADGKIITLDTNEELAWLPKKYFEQSEYAAQIEFLLENALDYLQKTEEIFDLIFIDADKENYPEYFKLAKEKTRPGSVILFDNVLWYGKILEENPKQTAAQQIKKLSAMAAGDKDFDSVILPIRDGIQILRRK